MFRIMSWLAHFEVCLLSSGRRCIFLVENTGRGTEKISGFYRDTCFKNTTNPLLQFSMKNVIETHVKKKYRRCCNVDRHLFPFCAETLLLLKSMNWKKSDTKAVLLLWNSKFPAKIISLSSERVTHNFRLTLWKSAVVRDPLRGFLAGSWKIFCLDQWFSTQIFWHK